MTNVAVETLPKNNLKLTITLASEDLRPYLEAAATRLSQQSKIPGFRPGKAGYEVVKQRLGEMKIYEEALESAVRSTFVKAVLEHDIQTVGSPKIDIEKLAPGNDLVFTAEVARMPQITKLADPTSVKVRAIPPEVKESDLTSALKDLQRMQTKEVRSPVGTPLGPQDKAVVAMDMKKGNVPVEGGQSPHHAIYLAEEYYIPGLKEQVVGMKEGDSRVFTLSFPKEHAQKFLAGADVEFHITLNELYRLEPPELDDAFAKNLGQKDFATLKDLLHKNLLEEKEETERLRHEKDLLEALAGASRFEEIPDLLVNEEVNKMLGELEAHVEAQGMEFDTYLKNMRKTIADLKLDFTPQALQRVKVALILQEVAKQQKIIVDEKELDAMIDQAAERYEDAEARKKIYSPVYREYTQVMMRNRKVIDHLKTQVRESA